MEAAAPGGEGRSSSNGALLALAVGGFSIGTGEFAIIGLLPDVARDLGVSLPAAGHLISAYALGVAVGAPVLAVLTAAWSRRALLIGLLAIYAVANLATVLAPGAVAIGALRFVAGLPHATYFGVAALVGATLVPVTRRARAVGLVMLGLTAAMLVGMPLTAWLGRELGWRAAFVFVGGSALFSALLIRHGVPNPREQVHPSPLGELGAFARPQVWMTLAIAAIGFGGLFCVFSYIEPLLVGVARLGAARLPLALSLFGAGSVAGNLIGAHLADRALLPTIGGTLVYAVLLLGGFGALLQHVPTALLGVFLLGGVVALGPALQVRLMEVAGDAQTLAAALNHSAFNVANALGAWLGGAAIALGWGWSSLGRVGAALALGGLVAFGASLALERRAQAISAPRGVLRR